MTPTELLAQLSSMNFTALDVETANEQYDSLCSLGIVRVENGTIVEERSYRIRPKVLRVEVINSQIHKLTEEDLRDEPQITNIWHDLKSMLVDHILVAHNASFDMEVLQRSLGGYAIEYARVSYLCSLKLAAEAFPALPSYRLKDLATYFQIALNHHDAISDARASAAIALLSLPKIDSRIFDLHSDELTSRLEFVSSETQKDRWDEVFGQKKLDSELLKPNLEVENKNNPFYNKRVVFTGDLEGMERTVAAQLIQAMGADINTAISKRTNIVIRGRAPGPAKMSKVESLLEEGHEIRLIKEDEFLRLVK